MTNDKILEMVRKEEPLIDWQILPKVKDAEIWLIGDNKHKVRIKTNE
jgi:hypothetical protein